MFMLEKIWYVSYDRYVSTKLIYHLWRKADILSTTCNAEINSEVVIALLPDKLKVLSS